MPKYYIGGYTDSFNDNKIGLSITLYNSKESAKIFFDNAFMQIPSLPNEVSIIFGENLKQLKFFDGSLMAVFTTELELSQEEINKYNDLLAMCTIDEKGDVNFAIIPLKSFNCDDTYNQDIFSKIRHEVIQSMSGDNSEICEIEDKNDKFSCVISSKKMTFRSKKITLT